MMEKAASPALEDSPDARELNLLVLSAGELGAALIWV